MSRWISTTGSRGSKSSARPVLLLLCALAAAVLPCRIGQAEALVTFRTAAVSGQRAPGTPDGVVFDSSWGFDDLVLDQNGRVAFRTKVSGPGISYDVNEFGLWSDVGGSLGKLAWAGEQAYGMLAGRVYWSFSYDVSQIGGAAAFKCITKPSSSYKTGVWSGTPGDLTLVAAEDNAAYGMAPGVTYYDLGEPSMNKYRQLAVRGQIQGTGLDQWTNEAVWVFGNDRLVAYAGQQAPGLPTGVGFWRFTEDPRINSLGRVAFRANLQLAKVSYGDGVWAESTGTLELVALKGSTAPDTTAQYSMFWSDLGFNDAGQVCYTAKLTGAGVTSLNENGLWVGTPGNMELLARDGDLVPGRGSEKFSGLTSIQPKICRTGEVAFRYGSGIGVCVGTPGNLVVIAHRDDPAAGLPSGVLYQTIGTSDINSLGDVAFKALVKGTGVTTANDQALWARVGGQTVLVLREGDTVSVAPGITKIVSSIIPSGYSGNEDGLASIWNDNRQLAFIAGFTDGSFAVLVAHVFSSGGVVETDPILPSVPEPGPENEWQFNLVPGDGRWFDPLPANEYRYEVTDGVSKFIRVGLPESVADTDGLYTVTDGINGSVVLASGEFYTFPTPVECFQITGIEPAVDGDAPQAFPTYLQFDQDTVSFTMTPVIVPTPLEITATADFAWVYQNTAITTGDRHQSVLTVAITGGNVAGQTYAITVQENGGMVTNFQVMVAVAIVAGTPQTGSVLGGMRGATTPSAFVSGAYVPYLLNVTVTGSPAGQTATVDVPLVLRMLGDIDGDGAVTATDKLEMNKTLNGLATLPGIGLRELDLTGDGATVNAEDKLVINQVLNGLAVP